MNVCSSNHATIYLPLDDFNISLKVCPDLVHVHQLVELLGRPHDSVGLVLIQLVVTSYIHRNSLR